MTNWILFLMSIFIIVDAVVSIIVAKKNDEGIPNWFYHPGRIIRGLIGIYLMVIAL